MHGEVSFVGFQTLHKGPNYRKYSNKYLNEVHAGLAVALKFDPSLDQHALHLTVSTCATGIAKRSMVEIR